MIGNILVPYDGSENSNKAFEYAMDLAKKYKSNITPVICISQEDDISEVVTGDFIQRQRDAASKEILTLESRAEELGVNFKGIILKTHSVTDAILSYAESNNIDFIVIGSRGLGGFKRLLLGSVASTISQYSKCPVMIIK